ncbi:TPR domain protein [Pseudomonas syringae pv. helianthi]|uniref:TPR domain protein n=3 Tax=Pseudomonas syringae group genomosp. 7 TaxID=251699 RepID=A0A0P9RUQ0_9PSED|nr:TPR domain protein [Pseudomonas syringae pv. helianthi]KPY80785.1 TPR domain-containing protein [Pseudomonas syringae pv. tagetis]RMR06209.1 TPR domain protein [Pseudomonas syringae pv. helianthi]RMV44887.1 TPR domain-containing protein [Pseudomonas syringae pv. helianthi]RMW20060.1 TPR domain protein [Pseudomonas syringae pv. tagetis]
MSFDSRQPLPEAATRQALEIDMPRLSTKGLSPQTTTRPRWLIGAAAAALLTLSLVFWWWRMPVQPAPARLSHTYAQALEQAHDGKPGAARVLYQQLARTDLSDEQRIALLAELSDYPSPQALKLLDAALGDRSAHVREAAIDVSVKLVSNSQRSLLLGPLLDDDEQSVRFRATSALLGLSPDDLGLYFAVLQQSAEAFQEALKSQPQNARNQLQLARLYLQTGDLEPAVAALQRATALDPGNIEAALAHIELLDRKGQAEQARSLFAQLLEHNPGSAMLQHALGMWLLNHGQAEFAVLSLAKATELAPDDTDYRYDLAVALHSLHELEAAQRQLMQIVQSQPANRKARVLLIQYWKENGQLQNVQILLAELEQQNPDDPVLQQGL